MTSKFKSGLNLSYKTFDLCQKRCISDGKPKGNLLLNRALNLIYESIVYIENSSQLTQLGIGGAVGWVSGHFVERKLGFYSTFSLGLIAYVFTVACRRNIVHINWKEIRRSIGKEYQPIGKAQVVYFKRGCIGGFVIGLIF